MIKHGIRLAPAAALALIPATMVGPASMASPAAARDSTPVAWVVNQSIRSATRGSVTPIDTATNTADKNIKVGVTPSAIVITPDGKTVYVLNLGPRGEPGRGSVTPINTATNTAGKPIPLKQMGFPDAPNLMVITPDGKTLYVVGNTTMTPVSTATNTAGKAIHVAPRLGTDSTVAITPDGRTVYVAGVSLLNTGNFVVPVSTATGAVGKTIVVRGEPNSMAVTPGGGTLYVLCAAAPDFGPQDVIPISTATNKAGPAIDTGLQPTAIAISR